MKRFTDIALNAELEKSKVLELVTLQAMSSYNIFDVMKPDYLDTQTIEKLEERPIFSNEFDGEQEDKIRAFMIRKDDERKFYEYLIEKGYERKEILNRIFNNALEKSRNKSNFKRLAQDSIDGWHYFLKRIIRLNNNPDSLSEIMDYIYKSPYFCDVDRFQIMTLFIQAKPYDTDYYHLCLPLTLTSENLPEIYAKITKRHNVLDEFKAWINRCKSL